ncbi:MAG: hypothetical protein SWX82_10310 [Cyanobacteriota bacterium]|nr:hypothetical protein [Cyanobacteriota bacterium]
MATLNLMSKSIMVGNSYLESEIMKIILSFLGLLISVFLILALLYEPVKKQAYRKGNISPTNSPEYRVFFGLLLLYFLIVIAIAIFFIVFIL